MAILRLVTAPDPILRQKASVVTLVNNKIRSFMDNMLETMYHEQGVGLAANQVGIARRILVIDLQDSDDKDDRPNNFFPLFMVNPEIIYQSEEMVLATEGCLSLPEEKIEIARASAITINFVDYHNKSQELICDGWLARAIQHEIDHLDGKLLVDYLSKMKKDLALRRLEKLKKHCL